MRYFGDFSGFASPKRKKSRNIVFFVYFLYIFIFSILFIFPAYSQQNGKNLFSNAIAKTLSRNTIECKIRLDIVVDGVEFSARGNYEEQVVSGGRSGDFQRTMFRQDLNFQMDTPSVPGTEPNRMTSVCHASLDRQRGRVWQYRSIEGEKTLRYIRLAVVEDAVRRSRKSDLFKTAGEVWNFGGIVGSMRQIEQFYEMDGPVEETEFTAGEKMSGWKISGSLKKSHFDRMLDAMGGLGKKGKYPSDLPSDIEIYVGKNDLFPYKIRYLNRNSEESSPGRSLMEITYFDVLLDGDPILEYRFATFDKGELPEGVFRMEDITTSFIQNLRL